MPALLPDTCGWRYTASHRLWDSDLCAGLGCYAEQTTFDLYAVSTPPARMLKYPRNVSLQYCDRDTAKHMTDRQTPCGGACDTGRRPAAMRACGCCQLVFLFYCLFVAFSGAETHSLALADSLG